MRCHHRYDGAPDALAGTDEVAPEAGISFVGAPRPRADNCQLACIHEVKGGGALRLEHWDPYTAEMRPASTEVRCTPSGRERSAR